MKLTLERAKELMDANNGNLNLFEDDWYTELPEELEIPGYLDISYSDIVELPVKLKVGGFLDASCTAIKELPDGLIVGGSLDVSHTALEVLPNNLTVGSWMDASCTAIKELPDNLIVGGSLILSHTAIEKLPDNLMVGRSLFANYTAIKKLPDNLMVGGWIDIRNTAIKELPVNLTVGNIIYCDFYFDTSKAKYLKNGDYVEGNYLYADGILTHVKKCHKVKGYTFYVGKIKGRNVISDGKNFAHCSTFREGVADLLFKSAKDRGANQYANVSLDDEFTVQELVTMYRIITGACKQGSESFVAGIKDLKEKYTVREAIQLTKGQYHAAAFEQFFG